MPNQAQRCCRAEASRKAAGSFLAATLPSLAEGTPRNGAAAAALRLQAAALGSVADATQGALKHAEAHADGGSGQEAAAAGKLQLPLLVSLLTSLGAYLETPNQALGHPAASCTDDFEAFAAAEGGEPAGGTDAAAQPAGDREEAETSPEEMENGDAHPEGAEGAEGSLQLEAEGQHSAAREQPDADIGQSAGMARGDDVSAEGLAHVHPEGNGSPPGVGQPERATSAPDLAAAAAAVLERCLQVPLHPRKSFLTSCHT